MEEFSHDISKTYHKFCQGGVILISFTLSVEAAQAALLTYKIEGIGTGSLSSNPFTDKPFTIQLTSDTVNITTPLSGVFATPFVLTSVDITGVGMGTFSDNQRVFSNNNTSIAGFSGSTVADIINFSNVAFGSYDLSTPIGTLPVSLNSINQFVNVGTTFGSLTVTNATNLVFTVSAVSAVSVPESSSPLAILGAGTAVGFGAFFKRKLAQSKKK